jgi:hypothetical protein
LIALMSHPLAISYQLSALSRKLCLDPPRDLRPSSAG